MKVGIITDVHGNSAALKAVLQRLDYFHHVERIYCLGDMIGIGPDTNEVLDILFSRDDILMVTGNHDEAILALANGQTYPNSHLPVYDHHEWILSHLQPTFIPGLSSLPRWREEEIAGVTCLFIHYAYRKGREQMKIADDPLCSIVEPSLFQMERIFSSRSEEMICFGHHHPHHYFKGNHQTYLNPGSLGCSFSVTAPFAVVTIDNGKLDIECEHVSYDNTSFLLSYERLQVPSRDFILQTFHGNQIANYKK